MINLIDGSLVSSQENIIWAKNKSSATIILNTHPWKEGEILIIGYETTGDIIIGMGMGEGIGPSFYKVLIDRSVVVVTEVLEEIPDISYYAFDQRYLVRGKDGDLYLTRRYLDQETGEIVVEEIKTLDRCVVREISTGDIWILDPPSLINLFDLTTKPSLEINEGGKIDLSYGGVTWKDQSFVNSQEKEYLKGKIFEENFEATVTGQKYSSTGATTTSMDPCIVSKTVYTLSTSYSGLQIDLDEVPKGWEKKGLGLYTKTISGGVSSSSGPVVCKLTTPDGYTGSKNIGGESIGVGRYIFTIYSPQEPTIIEGADKVFLSEDPNLGRVTIKPPQDSYTWFAFPVSFKPTTGIFQLGVNYVSKGTKIISKVIKDEVNLGNYIIYRSLNPGNGESQDINIE